MCYSTVFLFLCGSWFSTWRFRDPGSFCLCLKYSLVLSSAFYAFEYVHRERQYGDMEQTHLLTIQSGSIINEGADKGDLRGERKVVRAGRGECGLWLSSHLLANILLM